MYLSDVKAKQNSVDGDIIYASVPEYNHFELIKICLEFEKFII